MFMYYIYFIAVIMGSFLAIGLGVYAGFKTNKRWFVPIIQCIVFRVLFKMVAYIVFVCGSPSGERWSFAHEMLLWLKYDILHIPTYEIIMLCFWMSLSLLAMFVTVIIRGKKLRRIRILVSIVLIAVVISSWGIGLNRKYCPTFYKYPDYIVKEVLEIRDDIEAVYGEFDFWEEGYDAYGGYYAYTDKQGSDWYYTIHFLEGDVFDIYMEIH